MSSVLYRKYRPQVFADVVGQDHVVRALQNAIRHERAAHAYLFAGPRGTGKTTVARLLAKAVNCKTPKGLEPCTACSTCKEFAAGSALDLIEVDAASNRGIDEIRALREGIRFAPATAARKVFIVDEVHMLTREAFNALLKTLEEPPEHAMFILATTEPHKVPATVLSRVQRFDFRRIPVPMIVKRLASHVAAEGVTMEPEAREMLAMRAEGSMRDAESMLDQLIASGEDVITANAARSTLGVVDHRIVVRVMDALADGNAPVALRAINALQETGEDLGAFVRELSRYVRAVRMLQEGEELADILAQEFSETMLEAARRHASLFVPSVMQALLDDLLEAQRLMGRTAIPQLPLELALLEAVHRGPDGVHKQPLESAAALPSVAAPGKIEEQEEREPEDAEPPVEVQEREIIMQEEQPSEQETGENDLSPLSVEAVRGAWAQVLDEIRPHNNALHAFLQAAEIESVNEENSIRLAVQYDFHKERLAVPKHRKLLLDILYRVLGRPVRLQVTVHKGARDVVTSALKLLGGRLVG